MMSVTYSQIQNRILQTIKAALQSEVVTPLLLLFGFICWLFSLTTLLLYVYVLVFVLSLILLDDVKNIFSMVFFVAFFIKDIFDSSVWDLYLPIIGCGAITLVCFLVRSFLLGKGKLKKGQMFVSLMVAGVALLLGGLERFDIQVFGVTLGLFVSTYVLYFISVNFTKDLKKYLANLFICGALILSLQVLFMDVGYLLKLAEKPLLQILYVGAQNINVVSTYLLVGIACCFYKGLRKHTDVLYAAMGVVLVMIVFQADCRTAKLLSVLLLLVELVVMLIVSPNKILLGAVVVGAVTISLVLLIPVLPNDFKILEDIFAGDEGANGRAILWPWCINKFIEYPIFGYGFVASEYVPTTQENYMDIVMAHNTLLQWLTSLGIMGTLLMGYFYLKKYAILFRKLTIEKFSFILAVIIIALTGMMDQAPAMDFFVFFMPLCFVAAIEKEERKIEPHKLIK